MANRDADFARALRAMRARADLTQVELAQKCGINVMSVTNYENGESMPSFATAIKLADALGGTLNELAGKAA